MVKGYRLTILETMMNLCEALNLQPLQSLEELISEGKTLVSANPRVEVLTWNLAVALENLMASLVKLEERHPTLGECLIWRQVRQQASLTSPLPVANDDLWAEWPDGFLCPLAEVEDFMSPPFARSDDYAVVSVLEYDEAASPCRWERRSSVSSIAPT